jgi:hypothetical protein
VTLRRPPNSAAQPSAGARIFTVPGSAAGGAPAATDGERRSLRDDRQRHRDLAYHMGIATRRKR